MATPEQKIQQARWWALNNQPFYGSLSMNLADIVTPAIPTACTDGKTIRWNPQFVESLSNQELRFVLLHETLHCAHQHLWRLPETPLGNEAGDHEINLTLMALDGIKMPEGGLADPQYRNMACEEILARLSDNKEIDDQGGGLERQEKGISETGKQESSPVGAAPPAPDPCGSFTSPAADIAGDREDQQQAWQHNVTQAAQVAQVQQGDVPGDMQRLLERMRYQAVDWRAETGDFVRDAISARNDWTRSARRHAWQSVIYPRKFDDELGTVIFARDTSGSVSDEICAKYSALITDCVSETGCQGIVIDCDSRIQAEYRISEYEECPLEAKGGGGTDFRPVFDRANELIEQGQEIAGIVYLTDLRGTFPESSDIPTLWMATDNNYYADRITFGRVVRID